MVVPTVVLATIVRPTALNLLSVRPLTPVT
jgi:hypothetical protein